MSEHTQQADNPNPKYFMPEVFKKWHKYGFISVRYWPYANKVQIEIADVTSEGDAKTVSSISKCYLDAYDFLAYLRAEVSGNLLLLYPNFMEEGFRSFGGNKDAVIVSRVFGAGYWRPNTNSPFDLTKRVFRCEEYEGKVGRNGEISPIFDKCNSFNKIQMTMVNLAHLFESLNISMLAYAVQKADQVIVFDE